MPCFLFQFVAVLHKFFYLGDYAVLFFERRNWHKYTLAVSEDEQHAGEWYFEEFMIVANEAGELTLKLKYAPNLSELLVNRSIVSKS